MQSFSSLLKKPIIRILGFGTLLAVVLLIVLGPKMNSSTERRLVIGEDDFAHVLATWQKTWQRPPSRQELNQILNSYVRDEVLYQEAIKQELDKNNAMVKRSLIMQMTMLAESQAEQQAITEEDIQAYYALRQDQYQQEARISFVQLYFSKEKRGESAEADVKKAIRELNRREDDPTTVSGSGDIIMLESKYEQQLESQIDKHFGEGFAKQLVALPEGTWSGPVASSYGWHAVYITDKQEGQARPLEAVKAEIIREMEYEEKEAAKEQFFTELMQQYNIVYEGEVKKFMDAQ